MTPHIGQILHSERANLYFIITEVYNDIHVTVKGFYFTASRVSPEFAPMFWSDPFIGFARWRITSYPHLLMMYRLVY